MNKRCTLASFLLVIGTATRSAVADFPDLKYYVDASCARRIPNVIKEGFSFAGIIRDRLVPESNGAELDPQKVIDKVKAQPQAFFELSVAFNEPLDTMKKGTSEALEEIRRIEGVPGNPAGVAPYALSNFEPHSLTSSNPDRARAESEIRIYTDDDCFDPTGLSNEAKDQLTLEDSKGCIMSQGKTSAGKKPRWVLRPDPPDPPSDYTPNAKRKAKQREWLDEENQMVYKGPEPRCRQGGASGFTYRRALDSKDHHPKRTTITLCDFTLEYMEHLKATVLDNLLERNILGSRKSRFQKISDFASVSSIVLFHELHHHLRYNKIDVKSDGISPYGWENVKKKVLKDSLQNADNYAFLGLLMKALLERLALKDYEDLNTFAYDASIPRVGGAEENDE